MIPFLTGGILLGPSAIGRNKNYLETIFPEKSLPLISVVANLGLVLYLFIVGMELGKWQFSCLKTFVIVFWSIQPCLTWFVLDPKLLATHARKAGAIAFMGMAVPFALGIAISQTMFDTLQVWWSNIYFIRSRCSEVLDSSETDSSVRWFQMSSISRAVANKERRSQWMLQMHLVASLWIALNA